MSYLDWLIVLIPLAFVIYMGYYSRRYIRGVTDFLAAGRVCGRYVISVSDVACGLAVITLVAYIEVHYKVGFAVGFWSNVLVPLSIFLALTGYCVYRFRETKAMSLGQFLEIRYSRSFRIFAAALRSISEMLCNMICPAIAARFFIYFLDLPHTIHLFGWECPTFILVVLVILILAISIIWMGGTLALIITDTLQGLFCYVMLVVFCAFILFKFSWFDEIVPVMMDRAPGESFLNPYDIKNLRDFNLFAVVVGIVQLILHKASWMGGGDGSSAAKNPHEAKMASVLGTWRTGFSTILYILLAVMILTLLNHRNFSEEGQTIRNSLSEHIAKELIQDKKQQEKFITDIRAIPMQQHQIGKDPALSQNCNLDTVYFDTALKNLQENDPGNDKAQANHQFQQFRTLFNQLMLPISMRHLLTPGLMGLFCLLIILMMLSTDDSRIYSASLTITQDVIMPLRKKPFSPREHIWTIRLMSVGVGAFFLCGSFFMAQLDYINLFITITTAMWLGGCGPVMIFGLYSRFGTTAGAYASLISGMSFSLGGILLQRNWADIIYPLLARYHLVDLTGQILATLSSPFEPYIVWRMNPFKFPINSKELYFICMLLSLVIYCAVSFLTCKKPFNLDRMLHRGVYNIDGDVKTSPKWSFHNILSQIIGITPEYTKGDRIIAWSIFVYTIVYQFFITFVLIVIVNLFHPWPLKWWGYYFLITFLIIPGIVAMISTVWFSIGGIIDMRKMFSDLKKRTVNPLDDGWVEGNTSLADKQILDKIDLKDNEKNLQSPNSPQNKE